MERNSNQWKIQTCDGLPFTQAAQRTRYLCICAHPDDAEAMSFHIIAQCYYAKDDWISSVVVTDGGGSPRGGAYAAYTDEEMQAIRATELELAAKIARYSLQVQLNYTSAETRHPDNPALVQDLAEILLACRPEVVLTHNPTDKHDTHVAVMLKTLAAIRSLPGESRPEKVWGMEGWRNLDWVGNVDKLVFDASKCPSVLNALAGIYDSQISGGKRYDLALAGRMCANATFLDSHAVDGMERAIYGMDLTELVWSEECTPGAFAHRLVENLSDDIAARLHRLGANE